MSFDLNELRAQRERIREHLAWLDAQISRLEGAAGPESPREGPDSVPTASPILPGKPAPATPGEALNPSAENKPVPPTAPETPAAAPAVDAVLPEKPGGFEKQSKFGCILAGVAVTALILFLLFGLPFLQPDRPFTPSDTEQIAQFEQRMNQVQTMEQQAALVAAISEALDSLDARLEELEDRGLEYGSRAKRTQNAIEKLKELRQDARRIDPNSRPNEDPIR